MGTMLDIRDGPESTLQYVSTDEVVKLLFGERTADIGARELQFRSPDYIYTFFLEFEPLATFPEMEALVNFMKGDDRFTVHIPEIDELLARASARKQEPVFGIVD